MLSVITASDAPEPEPLAAQYPGIRFERLLGENGMTRQRNAGMERVLGSSDVVVFFDDDFAPSKYAIEGIIAAFNASPEANGVTGDLLADGIHGPGISAAQARRMVVEHDAKGPPGPPRIVGKLAGLYGCNMAFRTDAIGDLRFDERLPLYAWQEDVDFSMRVGGGMIEGLRGPAAPMGRRANLRVARKVPPTRQGLGEIHRLRRGMGLRRPYPPPGPTPRKVPLCLVEFRVGL